MSKWPIESSANVSDIPLSTRYGTHLAGHWFLHSGIQDPEGGVARYYRSDIKVNYGVSTEITGYTVSALVHLYKITGASAYLNAALRAGKFLIEKAWRPELDTYAFEYPEARAAYFFDCGIIARGLLSLYEATGQGCFFNGALAAGRSMARDFGPGPAFYPAISLPGKEPLPANGRWSRSPGCYQLKAAMAWQELFEKTGEVEFSKSYQALLDYSLQTHTGFLEEATDRERLMDRLHAYCYFLEGLLPCATRPDCARALKEGIVTVSLHLHELSTLFERSDVCAQLARLRLYAAQMGIAPLDAAAVQQETSTIALYQIESPDPRLHGGFWFGRRHGQFLPFVNPVSTAFCVQTLEFTEKGQLKATLSYRTLL